MFELRFSFKEEALQYLADISSKQIKIAMDPLEQMGDMKENMMKTDIGQWIIEMKMRYFL